MVPERESDPEGLLSKARAGEKDALGSLLELYRRYLTLLARLQIRQRLRTKTDASDLVQETFAEAHRDFEKFRGGGEPELTQWLRTILARRVAKLVRRYYGTQSRDVRLELRLGDDLDRSSVALERGLSVPQTTPSQKMIRRENAVLLADALESLPDHYRDVLVLRHLEGMSFDEVAKRLDRSVDSVKHVWSRALGQLRSSLGKTR